MWKRFRRYGIYIFSTVLIACCWLLACFYIVRNAAQEEQLHMQSERALLQGEIDSITNTYKAFGTYIFEQVINTQDVRYIVAEASAANDERRRVLRDRLYALMKDDYERILKYNFKQMQFHFKNGDSFLRFNAPELYGDNLFSLRDSVRIANTEQRPVFGFEEGRVFNGYRMVYPLFQHQRHIGSVEVAVSLNGEIKLLRETYPSKNMIYMLKRNVIEGAVFSEQQGNYVASPYSKDFLVDRETFEDVFRGSVDSELGQTGFIEQIKRGMAPVIGEDRAFGFRIQRQGVDYIAQFLPIRNVSQKPVGYFISISKDEHFLLLEEKKRGEILAAALVSVMILLLFFFYVHGRRKLQSLASIDGLTHIYNRLKFTEFAEWEMAQSMRYQKELSVLFFDLDDFKSINDTFGHSVGDLVLKSLTGIVGSLLRDADIFARWGGEEFIILVPETSPAAAGIVAERIRMRVAEHRFDEVGTVTISIGVAGRLPEDTGIEDVIKRADEAMYLAKATGKNRCEVSDAS